MSSVLEMEKKKKGAWESRSVLLQWKTILDTNSAMSREKKLIKIFGYSTDIPYQLPHLN